MKKKTIIIAASLFSMVALGGFATYKALSSNDNNIKEVAANPSVDNLDLEETDKAEGLYDNDNTVFEAETVSLNVDNEEQEIIDPIVGRQYYISGGKLSIRFYAAITDLNVTAKWTRALYDEDGNVVKSFGEPKVSTVAYKSLKYYVGSDDYTYSASDVEATDGTKPYKYFVIYTIKNLPESIFEENYTFDARVELSNSINTVVSKTCSVDVSDNPAISEIRVDELSVNNSSDGDSTAAGNGTFVNNTPKTLYMTGEEFSTDNYVAKIGNNTNLTPTGYSGFDNTKTGKQTVYLDFGRASTSVDVYVVDTDAYQNNGVYTVTVNQNYSDEIGAVNGQNGNMFATIGQALEFLQNTNRVPASSEKKLIIGAGYYFEKLEITTPNLTIEGAGSSAHATYYDDESFDIDACEASTIIEYNSLFGITDINNFEHKTDSTQTVAIRDKAVNCKISNVTISNANNCYSYFQDVVGSQSEHRALALLCQADQFVMEDSSLLGYQDTLELMTGRQYFKNCYISGTTDYIFGTNNITLFDACTIHTIYNGSNSSGGYVTAFKGQNKGSDSPEYGAVFKGCTLEGDSNTVNVALGRPWCDTAKVAFINCEMSDCISKDAYSNTLTQGARYVAFSYKKKNDDTTYYYRPTDENVQFLEYGNTGDGALDSAVNGMYFMTSSVYEEKFKTDALTYTTLFGKTNGQVTYSLSWDPVNGVEQDNNIYYNFGGINTTTGTKYDWDYATSGAVNTTFNGLTINTSKCQYYSAGYTEIQPGTMTLSVAAGSTVTVYTGYGTYDSFDINGIHTNVNDLSVHFDTAGTATITFSAKVYILGIVVSPNDTDYVEPTLSSIECTSQLDELTVGDDYDLSNLRIKATYSNNTWKYVTGYTTDADSVVDKTEAGDYEVTVTYTDGGVSKYTTVTVTYVADLSTVISKDTTFVLGNSNEALVAACSNGVIQNESVTIGKFTIDATEGKLRLNAATNAQLNIGTKITFTVAAGSKVKVTAYNAAGAAGYTINGVGTDAIEFERYYATETDITILLTDSVYLNQIDVIANATAPTTTPTLSSISVSGYSSNDIAVGTDYEYPALTVKAVYDDHSVITLAATDYSLSNDIDNTTPGTYTVTVTYNDGTTEKTTSYNVKYVAAVSDSFDENFTINFGSKGNYSGLSKLDISNANVRDNGDNNSQVSSGYITFKVKAGATITVSSYPNYTSYTISDGVTTSATQTGTSYAITVTSDSTITLTTVSSNNYYYSITISYPSN